MSEFEFNPNTPVEPVPEQMPAPATQPVEAPHRYIPIPWSREYFPWSNRCVCGKEITGYWAEDSWRISAKLLGHGHCPHELGHGTCSVCEEEKANDASRTGVIEGAHESN